MTLEAKTDLTDGVETVVYPAAFRAASARAAALTAEEFAAEILGAPFDADAIVELLPWKLVEFKCVASAITNRVRQDFGDKRADPGFRARLENRAKKEIVIRWGDVFPRRTLLQALSQCQSHHRLPISWGGNNQAKNIVFVEPALHTAIHKRQDRIRGDVLHILQRYNQAKKQLPPLHDALAKIGGAFLDDVVYVKIPFPAGAVCLPQLIHFEHGPRSGPHHHPRSRLSGAAAKGKDHG